MGLIKIPKKPVPSNKNETTAKSSTLLPKVAPEHESNGTAPAPIIDKLAITWGIESGEMAQLVHGGLYQALTNGDDAFAPVHKKLKGFNIGKELILPSTNHRPRIDYHHQNGLAQRVRLEFNPSKLGYEGLKSLHVILGTMTPNGWKHFIKHGKISRLDIAVDLVGVRLSKLKMLPPSGQQSQAWWGSAGKLETYQWGKPKGSHTQLYNKTLEQKKKRGVELPGPQITRIERRLKNGVCKTLSALEALPNPFDGIVLTTSLPQAPEQGPAYVWPLFCDSVAQRGLDQAVKLLPKEKKTAYRQQFQKAAPPWWDPEAIWAKWPEALKALKLADPAAWE